MKYDIYSAALSMLMQGSASSTKNQRQGNRKIMGDVCCCQFVTVILS